MSHGAGDLRRKVVPAQLGFLAIYNPSLGTTDETLNDQIVYYYSSAETHRSKRRRAKDAVDVTKEEENERLRHVGLAQGMVEFGKTFSEGKSVDTIETEKSRIILHELEAGWWILASIDLTRISKVSKDSNGKDKITEQEGDDFEYSSREVKPSALLLQDLLRAHSIFLLHHASSISALFERNRRSKFINTLGRYWDDFLSTWNVMLHGNPAVAVYGGIKLAGSGELGIGVGEEERGSGEREVLEGFVGRVEGLVDLIVSRFGDAMKNNDGEHGVKQSRSQSQMAPNEPWLGTGAEPGPADGAIFLGMGAISRKSLRDVLYWMEDLYSWGPRAYGVIDNPTSNRHQHKKKRRPLKATDSDITTTQRSTVAATVAPPTTNTLTKPTKQKNGNGKSDTSSKRTESPLPTVSPVEASSDALEEVATAERVFGENKRRPSYGRAPSIHSAKTGKFTDYFKLGYGTHWSLGGGTSKLNDATSEAGSSLTPTPVVEFPPRPIVVQESKEDDSPDSFDKLYYPSDDSVGHYLVGLIGDVEAEEPEGSGTDDSEHDSVNSRISLRTVTVELERESGAQADADISIDLSTADDDVLSARNASSRLTGTSHASSFEGQDRNNHDRNKPKNLQIVVYVNKPFIFTLLFERTDALALSTLYRSLHYQLAPLQRPLLHSTSQRLPRPDLSTAATGDIKTPIYDLIWDSKLLTISCTIPNIPPLSPSPLATPPPWSRLEALNTHTQILNTFAATRSEAAEVERTCKTSRGYWVVWTRIPDPDAAASPPPRKASGSVTPVGSTADDGPLASPRLSERGGRERSGSGNVSQSYTDSDTNRSSTDSGPSYSSLNAPTLLREVLVRDKEIWLVRRAGDGMGRDEKAGLARGIGVDTKMYVEGLLEMLR